MYKPNSSAASFSTILLILICPPLSLLITFGCNCNFILNMILLPFPLLAHGHAFAVQYSYMKHHHNMERFIEASRRRRYTQRIKKERPIQNDEYNNEDSKEEGKVDKFEIEKKSGGEENKGKEGGEDILTEKIEGGKNSAYHVVTKGDVEDFVRRSGLGEHKSATVEEAVDGE